MKWRLCPDREYGSAKWKLISLSGISHFYPKPAAIPHYPPRRAHFQRQIRALTRPRREIDVIKKIVTANMKFANVRVQIRGVLLKHQNYPSHTPVESPTEMTGNLGIKTLINFVRWGVCQSFVCPRGTVK